MAMRAQQRQSLCGPEVFCDHLGAHLLCRDLGHPAQLVARLAWVTEQGVDLGWAEVTRVDGDDAITDLQGRRLVTGNCSDEPLFIDAVAGETQVDAYFRGRPLDELAHRV